MKDMKGIPVQSATLRLRLLHWTGEGKRRGIRILFFLNFMSFMLFMVRKFFVLKEKDEEILTMKDMKDMKGEE